MSVSNSGPPPQQPVPLVRFAPRKIDGTMYASRPRRHRHCRHQRRCLAARRMHSTISGTARVIISFLHRAAKEANFSRLPGCHSRLISQHDNGNDNDDNINDNDNNNDMMLTMSDNCQVSCVRNAHTSRCVIVLLCSISERCVKSIVNRVQSDVCMLLNHTADFLPSQ